MLVLFDCYPYNPPNPTAHVVIIPNNVDKPSLKVYCTIVTPDPHPVNE